MMKTYKVVKDIGWSIEGRPMLKEGDLIYVDEYELHRIDKDKDHVLIENLGKVDVSSYLNEGLIQVHLKVGDSVFPQYNKQDSFEFIDRNQKNKGNPCLWRKECGPWTILGQEGTKWLMGHKDWETFIDITDVELFRYK